MHTPFQNLIISTDFNDDIANAQIEMRFRNVLHYVTAQAATRTTLPKNITLSQLPKGLSLPMPSVMHIKDIPFGNIDYAAYALYTSYRALGQSHPNIFIHVTDPGVGNGEDRSILVTDWGNVFIGPNNGSLALISTYLKERKIDHQIHALDIEKILEFEQHRTETPTYHLPSTFHGRDIFAVVAGMLAGGIPHDQITKKNNVLTTNTAYVNELRPLPQQLRTKVPLLAFKDNTYGNLKTNLVLDALTFDQLAEEGARFKICYQSKSILPWPAAITFQAGRVFKDTQKDEPVLYLGSTFAPEWDTRFVELAISMNSAAQKLNIHQNYSGAEPLTIERIF